MKSKQIHIAPSHGAPMQAVTETEVVAGNGLVGDRNCGKTRQVAVVCAGELAIAAAELGVDKIPTGATRRNLTVDLPSLSREHRSLIRIGEVQLEVRRDCSPCLVVNEEICQGAEEALRNRAGVSAHVLRGGILMVSDPVSTAPRPT